MLWQDIKPIILGFPVNTTLEPCFSRNLRIPWKDKLAADLEKAKEMDKWIDLDELDTCYSKYFPRNKVPNAKKDQKHVSKKKKLGTNQPRRSGTQKNAYNKITKYFPSQKSNVAIRRTVNKTMFKVIPFFQICFTYENLTFRCFLLYSPQMILGNVILTIAVVKV